MCLVLHVFLAVASPAFCSSGHAGSLIPDEPVGAPPGLLFPSYQSDSNLLLAASRCNCLLCCFPGSVWFPAVRCHLPLPVLSLIPVRGNRLLLLVQREQASLVRGSGVVFLALCALFFFFFF